MKKALQKASINSTILSAETEQKAGIRRFVRVASVLSPRSAVFVFDFHQKEGLLAADHDARTLHFYRSVDSPMDFPSVKRRLS